MNVLLFLPKVHLEQNFPIINGITYWTVACVRLCVTYSIYKSTPTLIYLKIKLVFNTVLMYLCAKINDPGDTTRPYIDSDKWRPNSFQQSIVHWDKITITPTLFSACNSMIIPSLIIDQ